MLLSRIPRLLSGWPRRLLAFACLLLAAWSAVRASAPSAQASASTAAVVVAVHGLAAGDMIAGTDVRAARWPSALRPASAVPDSSAAIGHRLAGALGAGEVITSERLVGNDLSAGLPATMIAVPVPLVDPGAAGLIRAGNHVDLLSPPGQGDAATAAVIVASGVLVLAVIPGDAGTSGASAQLVVAVDRQTELRIAAAITTPMLATVVKPP